MSAPQYLTEPVLNGHCYGTVRYREKTGHYEVEADPSVLMFVKRVFPGCAIRRAKETVVFKATKRTFGDLNWLLLRYPMKVECPEQFAVDHARAVAHAVRRDSNLQLDNVTPPPTFIGELYDYQEKGVAYLMANERTLLADGMGLGKTVQALAGIAVAGKFPVLIVTPPGILPKQWVKMVEKFLDMPGDGTLLRETTHRIQGMTPYDLPDVPIYLIHYGLLASWADTLREVGFPLIVFDELQELRHTGTQKYSAASFLSTGAEFVWGLSGTPIYNYGAEIWSVLNIVEYQCLGDFESFTREWCTGYGTKVVEDSAALGGLLVREGLMLRRRKEEVQNELPPKRRVVVDIEHKEGLYQKMIRPAVDLARGYSHIKDWHEKGQATREIEGIARRAAGVSKADAAAAFITTLVEAGERVLVFSYHHDVHAILEEELSKHTQVVRVTGKETADQKEFSVNRFRARGAKVILLSLRTAAGLDGLQGAGTCVVFVELDWSPAIHSQCEDRLHRHGLEAEMESLLCYYLVSSTGFDEVMQEALGLKVEQFVELMGDEAADEESTELAQTDARKHLQGVIQKLAQVGD